VLLFLTKVLPNSMACLVAPNGPKILQNGYQNMLSHTSTLVSRLTSSFPPHIEPPLLHLIDVSAVGSAWTSAASPLLSHLIVRTAKDVPHPTDPSRTLWDSRDDVGPFQAGTVDSNSIGYSRHSLISTKSSEEDLADALEPLLPALGSGSDYSVFIQRLGVCCCRFHFVHFTLFFNYSQIASSDEGFGSTFSDATYHYHSIYDTARWQELYADPGFHRHVCGLPNTNL
jgi:N-acetylated-alpha-linked acidic dipeptidase